MPILPQFQYFFALSWGRTIQLLTKVKETVALACGKTKAEAISGALRTGLIDTFVTDEYTEKKFWL